MNKPPNQGNNDEQKNEDRSIPQEKILHIETEPYEFPDRKPLERALGKILAGQPVDSIDHKTIVSNEELAVEYAAELLDAGKPLGEDVRAVLLSSPRNALDFAKGCRARGLAVAPEFIEKIRSGKFQKNSWELYENMKLNPEKVLREWMKATGLKRPIWVDGEIGRQGVQMIILMGQRLAYFAVEDNVVPQIGLTENGEIYEIDDYDGDDVLGSFYGSCQDAAGFDKVLREKGWNELPPFRA